MHPAAVLAVKDDADLVIADAANKSGASVVFWVVSAAPDPPKDRQRITARFTKAHAEIADHIFVEIAVVDDHVVGAFHVPVVDKRHHHHETFHLRRVLEWRAAPFPFFAAFHIARPRLETNITEGSSSRNCETWNEVVDLGHIPKRCEKPHGGCFGLSLKSYLCDPFIT